MCNKLQKVNNNSGQDQEDNMSFVICLVTECKLTSFQTFYLFTCPAAAYCCPPGGDFCSLSRNAILRLLISSGSSVLAWPEPEADPEAPGLAAARLPDEEAAEGCPPSL